MLAVSVPPDSGRSAGSHSGRTACDSHQPQRDDRRQQIDARFVLFLTHIKYENTYNFWFSPREVSSMTR